MFFVEGKDVGRRGVTLLELVVTLAVLALLAAMVVPVLRPPTRGTEPEPGALTSYRRSAINDGRNHAAPNPDGGTLVITPLGGCFPVPDASDLAGTPAAWDPVRCTAVEPETRPSDTQPFGTRP